MRKHLALLGMAMLWKLDGALNPRASLRLKVTRIGTAMFFPLVTLALSGPEKLLYWCGDAWKEHLSFMVVSVLLWSGTYSESCIGTQVTNVSPRGLAWEAFQKVTLTSLRVASETSEVKGWTSVRDAIRSSPGVSPPHLCGRTGRDEHDACVSKEQTKSDQEGKAFGVKSVYTPI